jgi:hypothetical protein
MLYRARGSSYAHFTLYSGRLQEVPQWVKVHFFHIRSGDDRRRDFLSFRVQQ